MSVLESSDIVLMCKDEEVFEVDTEKIIRRELLPGTLNVKPSKETFFRWMQIRYSQNTNTFARSLRAFTFGQGNRKQIDLTTHSFSLSDCYWIKRRQDRLKFKDLSPYHANFWRGDSDYPGGAVPTLYVNGFLPKYWKDKDTLVKSKDIKEVYCYQLAKELGIPCAEVTPFKEGIAVKNFTNVDVMFEPANCSGRIHPEDFLDEDVVRELGYFGFSMLFFDALIANGDRHSGNFGFLRDANTGAYLGPAPMFDFDHAFESHNANDILIRSVKELQAVNDDYRLKGDAMLDTLDTMTSIEITPYLRDRAISLRSFAEQ
ncbi:hypothetical protein ABE504_17730 [Paenibacillus oryzisoli]|uniref:hypothetical protein n=1 Tax=Paenibacillus oryzisoli TaxID=1850517 RepID=UPI003D27E7DA